MKSNGVKLKQRRTLVLARLQSQLESGTKNGRSDQQGPDGGFYTELYALTDNDKKRIEKEISILKSRI